MMARNSLAVGRPSRDEVAPWERQQLEPLERTGDPATANANAGTAVAVRHKRASRILSGSFFSSRGS